MIGLAYDMPDKILEASMRKEETDRSPTAAPIPSNDGDTTTIDPTIEPKSLRIEVSPGD